MITNDNKTAGIQNITPEFLSMIKLPDEKGKKLKYLIVVPISIYDYNVGYFFPLGTAYVSAALKASGREVFAFNMNYKINPDSLLRQYIVDNNIDVVLTGGYGTQFWDLKSVISIAKEVSPNIITVVGGVIISSDPETAIKALEFADYGIIGEGEITVNALAYALETGGNTTEINGIVTLRNGEVLLNKEWPYIPDLDVLPFPDYEGLEYGLLLEKGIHDFYKKYLPGFAHQAGSISISRSCPNKCTFCFHPCGDKYRRLSMDKFFECLNWFLSRYRVEGMFIEDEIAFSSKKFAVEFSRRIKPYNIKWLVEARVDMITGESLSVMKESGCIAVQYGIESACNEILKSMRKNITVEQVERAIRFASDAGIKVIGNLIFGDLEETADTFWRSVSWWHTQTKNNKNIDISMFYISSFPGSFIYKTAIEKGIIEDPIQFLKDGYPPVNVSKMTDDDYYSLQTIFNTLQRQNKLANVKMKTQHFLTVDINGICPHCLENIYYEGFENIFHNGYQNCPVCGKPIAVNPVEYCDFYQLDKNTEDLINGKQAVVWAVNLENFFWLLKAIPVLNKDNVKFVNKEKIVIPKLNHTVKTLFGKEIFAPVIINEENIGTIIVPNNPKVFKSIKNQCVTEFPQVKQIVHITELMA